MEGSQMPGWGVQEPFGLLTNLKVIVPLKHQQTGTSRARDPEMDPRTEHWSISSLNPLG